MIMNSLFVILEGFLGCLSYIYRNTSTGVTALPHQISVRGPVKGPAVKASQKRAGRHKGVARQMPLQTSISVAREQENKKKTVYKAKYEA